MTTRESNHCFSASFEVKEQGLATGGLRLRLTRELSRVGGVFIPAVVSQLLPLSSVIV